MAIEVDDRIDKFGTQAALGTSSSAVADGAFSIASDTSTITISSDVDQASVVLEADGAAALDAGAEVDLFFQPLNIQSTNDAEVPSANFPHVFMGTFPLKDIATNQFSPIDISLRNVKSGQEYIPFIRNRTGQSIDAAWDLHYTDKTAGPKAA